MSVGVPRRAFPANKRRATPALYLHRGSRRRFLLHYAPHEQISIDPLTIQGSRRFKCFDDRPGLSIDVECPCH